MNPPGPLNSPEPPAIDEQAIRAELVDMFDQRAPWPLILLNIVLAALLLVVWWEPSQLHWWWFFSIALVSILNIVRHQRYKKTVREGQADSGYWQASFTRGVIAIGLAWGIGGVLFYDPQLPLHSAVILLLICGIAAGVSASQASIWPSVVWFACCAILPPAVHTLLVDGYIHSIVGGLLLFFIGYILIVGRINHRTLINSVQLRQSNQRLLDDIASSESHFRALVENIPDLLTSISHDGHFLFESPTMEKILGFKAGSWHNKPALEMIHPEDQQSAAEAIQTAFETGSSRVELRLHDVEGNWRLFDCVGRRVDDREPPALVVNARDITERRKMEDELRQARDNAELANRIKSQFLATVSHEIRTPMHAILGMAEMLRQTELNRRQNEYVENFHYAGNHLLNLINDILDYSRLEAGGLQLANKTFDLDKLINNVAALLRSQAQEKDLKLQLSIDSGLAPLRRGDPQRLQQILMNLIGNAIKFTQRGEVNILVTQRDRQQVDFAVVDTGSGIAPEQCEQIFQPFTQLNSGSTREQGGTGLGLSISRHLVEAMGGRIKIDSQPGHGSRFSFTIPLPLGDDLPQQESRQKAHTHSGELPAVGILIADDSAMNQKVLSAFLQDSQCTIWQAHNGVEAVELFRQHSPDLVIMDMQMPQLDGGSATRQIRALENSQGRLPCPIIALSASAMEEDRSAALAAGCNEFHAKPLGREALFSLLHRYL